jgi:hypothetical protein
VFDHFVGHGLDFKIDVENPFRRNLETIRFRRIIIQLCSNEDSAVRKIDGFIVIPDRKLNAARLSGYVSGKNDYQKA